MQVLTSIWEFFANNILKNAPHMIGFIVLLGYLLKGEKWYTTLGGTLKAIIGMLILNVGSGGLVSNFRPILVGLKDRFNLNATVIDPYFGQNAVTDGVMEVFGKAFDSVMILLLIAFIVNILLLIIGTFMDMTPACLIFTPIFLPICQQLGMNTVHFGIMMIFNLCIGTITPPVGTTLFVGVKVGQTKIENVIKQLLVYFVAIFIVLLLVTYVPILSMWLPGLLGYV